MSALAWDLKKPCTTCPFMKSTPLEGSPDWLTDVVFGWTIGHLEHSCHQTDPKADLYKGAKKKQACQGFLKIQKNENRCVSRSVNQALASGQIDWKEVSGDGAYGSMRELAGAYVRHYQSLGIVSKEQARKVGML